jgi:hypothetical protein
VRFGKFEVYVNQGGRKKCTRSVRRTITPFVVSVRFEYVKTDLETGKGSSGKRKADWGVCDLYCILVGIAP